MFEGDRKAEENAPPAQPFKVTDRRKFTSEGARRDDPAEEVEEAPAPPPDLRTEPERTSTMDPGFERKSLQEPEGVNLTMLISAMAQQALLLLGEIPHPATGQPVVEPEPARLQIDMIDLLRVKCRGNLTAQEENLLDQVLYQLRMLYVARTRQGS